MLWGLNWIRAGSYEVPTGVNGLLSDYSDDPNGIYETALIKNVSVPFNNFSFGGGSFDFSLESSGGTWAPYHLASAFNSSTVCATRF